MPKLSIIIPALNEEDYVGNLLSCLKKQTFLDFEAIVVDSNSIDKTKEVVKRFAKKDKRISLISLFQKNVSDARNEGAKRANAERILFMDADVTIEPHFLEKALKELNKRELLLSGAYLVPDSRDFFDRLGHHILNGWFWAMQYVYPHMVGQCIFSTKKIHQRLKGFDSTILFAEDNDYVNRGSKFVKFRVLRSVRAISSTRRFQNENHYILGLKYALCPLYRMVFGEIRTNIFNYRMDLLHRKNRNG